MLKDLLASLQDATAKSQIRREASMEMLNSVGQASPVGASPSSGGGAPAPQGGLPPSNLSDSNPGGKASPKLSRFLKAVSAQESGGNYGAVGVQTKYGRAYGKYQILDANFTGSGGWDKEALGRDITLKQYLNNPKIQEGIAQHKLSQYFKQYGASGAAKAWYAGPGNANTNSDSPQYGGPSINDYAASVLKRMRNQ